MLLKSNALALILAVYGWRTLFIQHGISEHIASLCTLLIVLSRYAYSQFFIYNGASVYEIGAAPWIFIVTTWITRKQFAWHPTLLLLIPVAYFIKSSLILWVLIAIFASIEWRRITKDQILKLSGLLTIFYASKVLCDVLFVSGGSTPFSSPSHLFNFVNSPTCQIITDFSFITSGVFQAGIGLDDYVHYIFQHPGRPLLTKDSPILTVIYLFIVSMSLAIYRNTTLLYYRNQNPMAKVALVALLLTTGFMAYSYVAGKPISVSSETRHYRLAGICLLPLVIEAVLKYKFVITTSLITLLVYVSGSIISKFNTPSAISNLGIRLTEIQNRSVYDRFINEAKTSTLQYGTNMDWMFELNQRSSIVTHDDFRSIESIRNRQDIELCDNQSITFLIQDRFIANGKWDAIQSNFVPALNHKLDLTTTTIENWNIITMRCTVDSIN